MAEKPYFSIIIPTLNEEAHLPKLLQNLAGQTWTDFEVIVVDGKSEDGTGKIAQGMRGKLGLTLVVSPERNVSYQRNLGAGRARGQILVFFDADTQIPKTYLERVSRAFEEKAPDVLATWLAGDSRDEKDKIIAHGFNVLFEITKALKIPGVFGAMMAMRRKAFEEMGGFNEKSTFGEDAELLQRMVKAGYKYVLLRTPKYIFSMRRYRSEKTFKLLSTYAELNLKKILKTKRKISYPMGGHNFRDIRKAALKP